MPNHKPENQRFHPAVEILFQTLICISVILYVLEVDYGKTTHSLEGDPFWLW